MNFNEYQELAHQTAIFPKDNDIPYLALALCGEAGEVADKVKKIIRDHSGDFTKSEVKDAISHELGDCLWYIANLALTLGCPLESIAQMNIDKINRRKENGTLRGSGDNR